MTAETTCRDTLASLMLLAIPRIAFALVMQKRIAKLEATLIKAETLLRLTAFEEIVIRSLSVTSISGLHEKRIDASAVLSYTKLNLGAIA